MRDIDFRFENRFLNKGRIICPQGFTECNEKLIERPERTSSFYNKINLTEQHSRGRLLYNAVHFHFSDLSMHQKQFRSSCPLISNFKSYIFNISKIKQSSNVTVSWVWQKNMMYNKSGLAGDCRNNLQQRKRNYSELLAARSATMT
ncbi:hypothetical protein ALC57_15005 [Trachymyrmex cornetzi]|uniref:Uncharacterized protein n=1 Tax=Trachymyrmex cornetzi TaxID=471704 RepID=A0A195DJ79_9HYME|nr:hypothetical protein ALC57_15005 [Trachymyrmex cornetzi]